MRSMRRMVLTCLAMLAAWFGLVMPALAERVTLSGEVTYNERLALPSGSSLRVRLLDLARPDAPARIEAEAAIASPGKVPLTFTLNFDSAAIEKDRSYALVAEIWAGGGVIFRNAELYPVDPLAQLTPILIIVSYAGRHAEPAHPPADVAASLLDITWRAETIGGRPVLEEAETSLSIASDMRAGGRGGCNHYFAQAEINGNGLAFSAVAATQMACSASLTDQETRFFAALAATRFWRIEDGTLTLLDATGVELVRLGRDGA